METTKVGNPSPNWKAAIEELINGRDLAARLAAMLAAKEAATASVDRELVGSISASFSRALAALESVQCDENCQDDFSQRKRKIPQEQRGSNRRRSSKPCVRKIAATFSDGHSWRKYGQKEIFNSKFPRYCCVRSYFRCTYKHEQNCLATRQVQQSEEDPSLYVITYFGEHTCRGPVDFVSSLETGPCVIDFRSNAAAAATKVGFDEDVVSNTYVSEVTQMDALDESDSALFVAELMGGPSDHGDVTSSLHHRDDVVWDHLIHQSFGYS